MNLRDELILELKMWETALVLGELNLFRYVGFRIQRPACQNLALARVICLKLFPTTVTYDTKYFIRFSIEMSCFLAGRQAGGFSVELGSAILNSLNMARSLST
jgi:hypothetical protein